MTSVPNFEDALAVLVLLDHLDALARRDRLPVLGVRRRHEALERGELGLRAREELADQVLGEVEVLQARADHRAEVVQAQRREQPEVLALLEVLGAEPGVGAEHEVRLAVDDARVQVRDRHGRRTDVGFAVDLRLVLGDERRVVRAEELAADREAAVALRLGDAGRLEERQRAAAGADEHEPGLDRRAALRGVPRAVLDRQAPAAVLRLLEVLHLVLEVELRALRDEVVDELLGEGAEVDVRPARRARRRDRLVTVALGDQERGPLGDDRRVVRELELAEQRVAAQGLEAATQVVDVLRAAHERHARGAGDEARGLRQGARREQVVPELARHLELLVDLHRLGDVDRAVRLLRRVVQLAQGGMTRPGVVPRVRRLLRHGVQALVDAHRPGGLQDLQECPERGAHDATADEGYVDLVCAACGVARSTRHMSILRL